MFRTLVNAFKNKEVRIKIIITLLLLLVYRFGCWLPMPGLKPSILTQKSGDTLLGLLSAITGGALRNGAILALGITPYINSSIIIQLLTMAIPSLEKLTKQGEDGRKKITNITRLVTVLLALAQSIAIAISWERNDAFEFSIMGGISNWIAVCYIVLLLVCGAIFTMWLGERITDYGIGNGISLLIFIGILSSAAQAILGKIYEIPSSDTAIYELLGFLLLTLVIFIFIIFVDLGERKIPVQYAKQIKGRKQYGGQSTYIPIKINASGVMPIIFAMALVTFPQLIMSFFWPNSSAYSWYMRWIGAGRPIYMVLTCFFIFVFSFFYASAQFKPDEVSKNIQQYGGFIPGIRPGKPTMEYLKKISNRLTLFGALFLSIIALIPSLVFSIIFSDTSLVNAFSATGLLIVVAVALEFDKQLQAQLMMKHYKGFLK